MTLDETPGVLERHNKEINFKKAKETRYKAFFSQSPLETDHTFGHNFVKQDLNILE